MIEALLEAGYRWLLVQEHSVEQRDGTALSTGRNTAQSAGGPQQRWEELSITALIKTQGSDTKLVGQMQPCYEALSPGPQSVGGQQLPRWWPRSPMAKTVA